MERKIRAVIARFSAPSPSWPGLSRPSTPSNHTADSDTVGARSPEHLAACGLDHVDGRDKPGHDGNWHGNQNLTSLFLVRITSACMKVIAQIKVGASRLCYTLLLRFSCPNRFRSSRQIPNEHPSIRDFPHLSFQHNQKTETVSLRKTLD